MSERRTRRKIQDGRKVDNTEEKLTSRNTKIYGETEWNEIQIEQRGNRKREGNGDNEIRDEMESGTQNKITRDAIKRRSRYERKKDV